MNLCEWLTIESSEDRERLLETLFRGHQTAARNNENLSSTAIMQVAAAGRGIESSIAGGLMTLGEIHGPVSQARVMIFGLPVETIRQNLEDGRILPGWGNAFFKKSIDPAFKPVSELIRIEYPEIHDRIVVISDLIWDVKGTWLYPNGAAFTAVVADILELPLDIEMVLAIGARLPVWAGQFLAAQP